MSKMITDILDVKQPAFQHSLSAWEIAAGRPGHDVRLVSDIKVRSRGAVTDLGLEAGNTTPQEIYFALQEKARHDNQWLGEYLGIKDTDTPETVLKLVISWLKTQKYISQVWVCRSSVIKTALKKQPPKALIKALGLRSVDSMLKRNNVDELLPLSMELESAEWVHKFRTNFKRYEPKDFDEKQISIRVVSHERALKLQKAGFPVARVVSPCYELGSLTIVPPKKRFRLDVLAITLSLAEAMATLARYSAYYRAISVRGDFGQQLYFTAERGINVASTKLSPIGWNSVYRHLANNNTLIERVEQPYLTKDDFRKSSALDVLNNTDPRFAYWYGLDFVFFHKTNEIPVSMHLIDVVTNASNRFGYQENRSHYGHARLWDELWSRYLINEEIADKVLSQFLNNDETAQKI